MDGSTFYFVAWIGWIIVTFYEKGPYPMEVRRLYTDFYNLLSVTCNDCLIRGISKCSFTLYYFFRDHAIFRLEKLYSLLSALIIAMLYTSFHLLEIYDPIWIVVDRVFLLSSALVYASVLLHGDRILRLCSLYVGCYKESC